MDFFFFFFFFYFLAWTCMPACQWSPIILQIWKCYVPVLAAMSFPMRTPSGSSSSGITGGGCRVPPDLMFFTRKFLLTYRGNRGKEKRENGKEKKENCEREGGKLTAHNLQNWKRVFLTCPWHKIYRDEAVGLKSSKYTLKITIYVNMWNLGQFREILIFCQ